MYNGSLFKCVCLQPFNLYFAIDLIELCAMGKQTTRTGLTDKSTLTCAQFGLLAQAFKQKHKTVGTKLESVALPG